MSTYSTTYQAKEDEALSWLARLESPELSSRDEKAFFSWLNASPLNQAAYIKAEALWEQGGLLSELKLSDLNPQRQANAQTQRKPASQRITTWATVAAATFVIACACFIWSHQTTNSIDTSHYATQIGEQKEHLLQDGSRIILNTHSELEVAFSNNTRIITLKKGEAFFDVQKDSRPFEVHTPNGAARVLGTQFSVNTSQTDSTVTVIEGRVAVGKATQKAFETLSELVADQQTSMQQAKAGQRPTTVNAKEALAWRQKQLIYQGKPLHTIVNDLNRYFGQEIIIEDQKLMEIEAVVVIQISTLDNALSALATAFDLHINKHTQNGKTVVTLSSAAN